MQAAVLCEEAATHETGQRRLDLGLCEAAALGDRTHRLRPERDRREDAEPVLVREEADEGRGIGHGVEPYSVPILALVAGKIRVVVAKPGLDGHDRGAKIIARALRDAGMEVIYTGLHQTPEQIVETAIQEDADAVGISILSGAHMTLVPRILELLRENGVEDVVVVVGGTIPDDDANELRKLGVAGVFGPGAPTTEIVDFLKGAVAA